MSELMIGSWCPHPGLQPLPASCTTTSSGKLFILHLFKRREVGLGWYQLLFRIAGPRFMKDRQPYDTTRVQIVYNLLQTLLSLWIWLKTARFWLTGRYNWLCQPVDYSGAHIVTRFCPWGIAFVSDSYDGMYALDMTWWYFFSKFIDYFDSLFFLLRKKFTHLSVLHVIHHGIMPLTAWSGVKWGSHYHHQTKLDYTSIILDGLEEVTQLLWASWTWVFMSSCISTTSCRVLDPVYKSICGGKGKRAVNSGGPSNFKWI